MLRFYNFYFINRVKLHFNKKKSPKLHIIAIKKNVFNLTAKQNTC